ncbi:MAG: elongation factor 4, partial [Planctomycetes bacterium]|nr:elongation factor 4 [Planctomycetota bacterium]
MPEQSPNIRNFSIIAHIDHGKSTLADRLLQATNAVSEREARDQILDSMDLERERGITIKASAVTVMHRHKKGAVADDLENEFEAPVDEAGVHRSAKGAADEHGELYMLNFIDTPGHVDFNYEVSRALKACEGAILVVDSTQGVQAQTLVNAYLAVNENLTIIPVINKIDLPSSRPDEVAEEIEQTLGFKRHECLLVSAKTGQGIKELLAQVCERLPAPRKAVVPQLRALIFDAVYDDYRGVVVYCRIFDGQLKVGDKIRMIGTQRTFLVTDLGKMTPKPVRVKEVGPGETCYVVAAIRTLKDVRIGDTVTLENHPAVEPLPGYQPPRQMVFCDFYPATREDGESTDFEDLREAVEKLSLNDSSFTFAPVHSEALGFGFRCGFLGLLHMDIIQERLEREGGVEIVQTAPTVSYQILCRSTEDVVSPSGQVLRRVDRSSGFGLDTGATDAAKQVAATGPMPTPRTKAEAEALVAKADAEFRRKMGIPDGHTLVEVHNPAELPNGSIIAEMREPICRVDLMVPKDKIGDIMKLCLDRRGQYKSQSFVSATRDLLQFEIPLAEIIYDFFDKMKGLTSGYGTMDYEVTGYRTDNLVKMDILVNGDPVEALSIICHRDKAEQRGRVLLVKLREQIPRHQFEIPLQAAIGGKIIARETIKAFRKDVLAKCYGG